MPGDIKYKDINGDGMVDKLDMVPLTHSTYPLLMYGLGAEIRYKNLTLGVLFKGTGKTSFFYVGQKTTVNDETRLNGMGYMPFFEGNTGNVLTLAANPANRWIPKDYAIAHGIDPSLAENKDARSHACNMEITATTASYPPFGRAIHATYACRKSP